MAAVSTFNSLVWGGGDKLGTRNPKDWAIEKGRQVQRGLGRWGQGLLILAQAISALEA